MPEREVLYCHCAFTKLIPKAVKRRLLRSLLAAQTPFTPISDLCALAARQDPRLARWAKAESLLIIACHPRAVRALFHSAGAELRAGRVEFLNLRSLKGRGLARRLGRAPRLSPVQRRAFEKLWRRLERGARGWMPWFPVMDAERCSQCGRCLNFCLFGVYSRQPDGKIRVVRPANCKTNCPACARVCPRGAIIFAKHPTAPINGGAGRSAEPVKVDLAALVSGDVVGFLRRRGADSGRKSTNASELLDKLEVPRSLRGSLTTRLRARRAAGPR
jgi:ferredoxin